MTDWNADEAAFNGMWFSLAGALNAPTNGDDYIGTTEARNDGTGVQQAWSTPTPAPPDEDWMPTGYVREFYTVSGIRTYLPWIQTAGGYNRILSWVGTGTRTANTSPVSTEFNICTVTLPSRCAAVGRSSRSGGTSTSPRTRQASTPTSG